MTGQESAAHEQRRRESQRLIAALQGERLMGPGRLVARHRRFAQVTAVERRTGIVGDARSAAPLAGPPHDGLRGTAAAGPRFGELACGMVLAEDLVTDKGVLLVGKGQGITLALIERLRYYYRHGALH